MFQPKLMHNLLAPLIAANTVSADQAADDQSNRGALEILANQLERLQFDCQLLLIDSARNKWNLIAHRQGTSSDSRGLLFSGHIDTVAADESLWSNDPWSLQSAKDQFFGLGVTDMKGFFATLIAVLQNLPIQTKHPITIIATADEETTMAGARALKADMFRQPALAIIGEPTNMSAVLSHKGYLAYQLKLFSAGGHSSIPNSTHNCLNAITQVNLELIQLAQHWSEHFQQPEFSVPFPTINLGTLNAGDSVNKVCSHVTLNFDVRPIPQLCEIEVENLLNQAIKRALSKFQVDYQLAALYPPVSSFHSSLSANQREVLQHQCGCHFSHENYVTEAGFFERLGIATVVLGPGSIQQAHQINEFISWQQLERAQRIYKQLLHHWCY